MLILNPDGWDQQQKMITTTKSLRLSSIRGSINHWTARSVLAIIEHQSPSALHREFSGITLIDADPTERNS